MLKTNKAFTMAEILIALTIIGVLAAIVLPSIMVNVRERMYSTERKAFFTRLNQAIAMLPSINSYGFSSDIDATNENSALAFVTNGLGKVMNMDSICDNDHLFDCGVPEQVTTMSGLKVPFPKDLREFNPAFTDGVHSGNSCNIISPQAQYNTKAASFLTLQGEAVAVFYNPACKSNNGEADNKESEEGIYSHSGCSPKGGWHFSVPKMCVNLIYDLNGKKGPNLAGQDIGFMTVLYPTDSVVVAPVPSGTRAANGNEIAQRRAAAACRAENGHVRVPTLDEVTAIFYNRKLFSLDTGANNEGSDGRLWSSTLGSPRVNSNGTTTPRAWYVGFDTGRRILAPSNGTGGWVARVRCVKR